MEYDTRIDDLDFIYDPFDVKNTKSCIGDVVYATNNITDFSNIDQCERGTLVEVETSPYASTPYKIKRDKDGKDKYYTFYVPEFYVNTPEKEPVKTYRPYTIEEWKERFKVGETVRFRHIKDNAVYECLYTGYGIGNCSEPDSDTTYVFLGHQWSLTELFDLYEWTTDDVTWERFGVEE